MTRSAVFLSVLADVERTEFPKHRAAPDVAELRRVALAAFFRMAPEIQFRHDGPEVDVVEVVFWLWLHGMMSVDWSLDFSSGELTLAEGTFRVALSAAGAREALADAPPGDRVPHAAIWRDLADAASAEDQETRIRAVEDHSRSCGCDLCRAVRDEDADRWYDARKDERATGEPR